MTEARLLLETPATTHRVGLALGRGLPGRAIVLCSGGLGSGKTTLCKSICEALGVAPQVVTSPTYTLVNVYPAPRPVYHVDLYRLETPEALLELDRDDWVNLDGVTLIEWPAAARPLLAGDALLDIELALVPGRPDARSVRLQADHTIYAPVLEALADLALDPRFDC